MSRGKNDKFHKTTDAYRDNYNRIFSEKSEEFFVKNKKVLANNGKAYYTDEFTEYLIEIVGEIKIKKDGWI